MSPLALVIAYLALATLFAVRIPLWEAPDAVWHYSFAAHLAAGNGLPTRADEGRDAPWRQQGSQPPLYYLLVAPLIAAVDTSDAPDVIRFNPHAAVGVAGPGGNANRMVHTSRERWPWRGTVLAARLVGLAGVVFGLVAVLATWAAARVLFPARPAVALATAGVLAFNPELLFFAGSISNDIAIAAAGAVALWRMAVVLRDGATPRACAWLGVACGLALLTKLSGLWLLPAAGIAMAWAVWKAGDAHLATPMPQLREPDQNDGPNLNASLPQPFWGRGRGWGPPRRAFLITISRAALWFGVPLLAVAGWWYLRNLLLFGDPTGLPLMLNVMAPREIPPTWREMLVQLAAVWRSYWAVFGWFNIAAPDWVYRMFDAITLVGLGGLAGALARRRLARAEVEGVALAGGVVGLIVVALVAWAQVRYPQGRLAFPAAPALSLLIGAGWTVGVGEVWGRWVAAGLAAIFGGAALWLLVGVVEPRYAHLAPAVSREPLEARATFRSTDGGERLDLIAVAPEPDRVVAGSALPITLTWAPATALRRDYSVFLHVLDENDLIVAQRDSYPQSGNAPTSGWQPRVASARTLYGDTHALEIPPHAPAPCDCRLILGVYDAATGDRLRTADGRDHVDLGRLRIEPRGDAGGIPNPLNLAFGDDVVLQGYNLDRRAAPAGERIGLTLYWKTRRRLGTDFKVSVQLRRGASETWAQHDEPPADGARPTTGWRPEETVVDAHPVLIYPEAPPDVYTLYIKMYDPDTWQALPVNMRDFELALGSFKVLPARETATP